MNKTKAAVLAAVMGGMLYDGGSKASAFEPKAERPAPKPWALEHLTKAERKGKTLEQMDALRRAKREAQA